MDGRMAGYRLQSCTFLEFLINRILCKRKKDKKKEKRIISNHESMNDGRAFLIQNE